MQRDGGSGDIFLENHYAKLFQGRWASLYESLKKPVNTIALIPPFYSDVPDQQEAVEVGGIVEQMEGTGALNEDPSLAFLPTVLPWCYRVADGTAHNVPNLLVNKTIFDANGYISRLNDNVYYLGMKMFDQRV
ncbi:conserved hypothetical protein [Theileria equi strain WA]|uniref:Uncharacterized protein n=1 Tax=Theileria equi strain WA TaxID=1537102 RepID=L1LF02_THEEQ|nr:conserved hypothetical protein [Theileria equi strain WA]EKX73859.1 conserved hypothetical protein [Theileria equi strain WA]|eukprot:XP_004833311.1 conserved hypothetical protein [Theileria equi strain WA]